MPLFQGRSTMSDFGFLTKHRSWEDWLGMLLGVLIVVSPWFPLQGNHDVMDSERSIMILNTLCGRYAGVRPCPARICRVAALGGGGRDRARALADRFTADVRLFR